MLTTRAGLGALLVAAGCATNPATGARQLVLISEGQELAMGLEADQAIVASMGLDADSARQRYVQELGTRLARRSERPGLPWTFRVLDDPVVNAFALPGGYIYVTRGILAHLDSEAELAAVLGHEIGHVTARHSVTRLSTQQLTQLGLTVGVALEPGLQRYAALAAQGLGLLFLKFSRDDERQADDLGLRYLRRTQYDPREMPGVYVMLDRVGRSAGGDRLPDWLSTHPNPVDRRQRIERAVAALPPDSLGSVVNRAAYLRRLDGLVYGDNPREGFFRGGEFNHPDLRLRLVFPAGWKTANQRQTVLAVSPQRDALVQLSLAREESPEAAARAFFGQPGVSGIPGRLQIHGLPAAGGSFTATADQAGGGGSALAGTVAFVAYDSRVFQLLGYASQGRWAAYAPAVERTIGSFDRLTDPAALAVEPLRLDLVALTRSMSLEEFAQRYPSAVPSATLALLNNVEPGGGEGARFAAGDLVKRVVGKPLPPP
ncbi:MAG: M48 family metalloprotease [Gemmatimonadales bacterium]